MTISQILNNQTTKLKKAEIKNPHLEAEILLSYVMKMPREWLFAHGNKKLTAWQNINYKLQIARRAKGVPLSYITGHKEFYNLDFKVNKHTLIPRPETELIIDETVNHELLIANHKSIIIDVGTGSGCIIITLAKHIENKNAKFYATDISANALKMAKKNAKLHGLDKKIVFFQGNLLTPIIRKKIFNIQNSKFVIYSNLPYLTPKQYKSSPTIQYEPKNALAAGSDGLKYYCELFKQISTIYDARSTIYVYCEIDPRQKKKILSLAKKYLPDFETKIKNDLRGHSRLAILEYHRFG